MTTPRYVIVVGETLSDLSAEVNSHMEEGLRPVGAPFANHEYGGYAQALMSDEYHDRMQMLLQLVRKETT